jgi:hypothetical protein
MHDSMTGKTAADAAKDAARLQSESGEKAIKSQEEFQKRMRADLDPFRKAGKGQLGNLSKLISNPWEQKKFIQNNPFFNALAGDAQKRLMNVQAAQGRLGSGDTPAALQNQLLLLGSDLLNQSIGQRMNLSTMGQNAAAMQGSQMQNTSNNISELLTGVGNAQAAGGVGAANAMTQGTNNMMNIGMGVAKMFLSDRRMKCYLEKIGEIDCGIPVYRYEYIGSPQKVIGVMAQDVEPIVPSAVLDVFGVKFVDYGELERVLH